MHVLDMELYGIQINFRVKRFEALCNIEQLYSQQHCWVCAGATRALLDIRPRDTDVQHSAQPNARLAVSLNRWRIEGFIKY
jgi:hypothetical protein